MSGKELFSKELDLLFFPYEITPDERPARTIVAKPKPFNIFFGGFFIQLTIQSKHQYFDLPEKIFVLHSREHPNILKVTELHFWFLMVFSLPKKI